MVELDGDEGPFKRPGAVPFNWEIRPGIPKIRTQPDDSAGPTLLQPPKKLSPLIITKLPPSAPAVSPFALPPPSSFKLKPRPDSHSSGPPHWRCSSARPTKLDSGTATALRRWSLFKSLLRFKKSKTTPDVKNNTGFDSTTTSLEESDVFYDSKTKTTTFPPSEPSTLSSSCFRMKRNESDLSSSEKRIILMMERDRLNRDVVV
ncbi:hypothetical protein N665_0089s0006 [Sinapis alba]|nr:hypothetical protein N665_0089s0006 [Sinapis alba]